MLNKNELSKMDTLIYKLYVKNNEANKIDYIIENDSILEDRMGVRLTVEEPIIEWTIQGKIKKMNKKVFLISKDGNINKESEKRIDQKERDINEFINTTSYKLEKCTDNIIRMTKEESSITYKLNGHYLEKERTIKPSIIYLNNQGQVLDIISLENKSINNSKIYTK